MSGRLWKWIFVLALILLALYSVYPPVRVAVEQARVTEKTAQTEEEAKQHEVKVGERYEDKQVTMTRFLPLAAGEETKEEEIVSRAEDGSVVKDVTTYKEGRIKLGLDIAGGTELLYQLKGRKGEGVTKAVEQTIKILSQRIDPQNVKEFRIQPFGEGRILIQVPKASREEVDRLKRRLMRMGRLEFRLGIPRGVAEFENEYAKADKGEAIPGYDKVHLYNDPAEVYYLVKTGEAAITGQYLDDVSPARDEKGQPAVGFAFNARGSKKFALITERNQGWLLAIILDDVLRSAPVIKSRIAGRGIIEGKFSKQEVADLITVLRAGSLAVDLKLLQESTVGPQLGRDSIRKGLNSIVVAGVIVLVFIGIYYLRCGVVADVALILNLVFLAGVLGLLGAALTLPGVAGILLTVGMAVDANVLIFERIREEVAGGKGAPAALRNGYDKAYTTIVDANVTTLLTAGILYLVGTGPVRGFAVTLMAGIALSMFTALFVTRMVLETMLDKGWLKEFRMLSLLHKPSLSYARWRKAAFVCSAIVVIGGMVAFFGRGARLYDVDFTGGSLIQLSLDRPMALGQVRDKLADGGFARAEVQAIQTPGATSEGTTDFGVRIKGADTEGQLADLLPKVQSGLAAAGLVKEKGVKEGQDGHSIVMALSRPATELEVRQAIAGEGGDPFDLDTVSDVLPDDDVTGQRFLLRLRSVSPLADEKEIWTGLLDVLASAGLAREACLLSVGEVQVTEDADADARLEVKTGRKIQWQLLWVELARLQFADLSVAAVPEPSDTFVLTAPANRLEQFKVEAPAELRLPVATFEGTSVEASVAKPFLEADLRAFADREGLGEVDILATEATSKTYTLKLSYERIKERMGEIFAEVSGARVRVTLSPVEGEPDADGRVKMALGLSEPLTASEIQYFLEEAGLGADAGDLIADELPPEARTKSVTLLVPADKRAEIENLIAQRFGKTHPVRKIVSIGSVVAKEMKGRALLAVICASVVIVFYVALRFHAFRFGVAAVIALIHDVLITAGLVALADWSGALGDVKINLAMLAAFLTIMGYSLNDTIVVFDRIRENLVAVGRRTLSPEIVDNSINQVLSRTILTSVTTLVVVVVLYFLGGPVLKGLAFTLIVGVAVGTYSSVFIASPVLLDWAQLTKGAGAVFKVILVPVWGPFWAIKALRKGRGQKQG